MDRPARLSASLLARKGEALPAGVQRPVLRPVAHAPLQLPVVRPPERTVAVSEPQHEPPRRQPESPSRRRLTVRLDPARYTRLRIAAARRNRTSQELIVEALDALLDACGATCPCLQGEPPGPGAGCRS